METLSKYETGVIRDIVKEYPMLSYAQYCKILYSIFSKDIQTTHFFVLGLEIGKAENRKKQSRQNLTNFQTWQRPN